MKYKLFIFLAVVLSLSFFSASPPEERSKAYIYWDQRALTWADFKGSAPGSSKFIALTHSAIKLDFGGEGKNIWFTIESIFYPKKSWKKKGVDDHILKHEQGHFDITEIYSRVLRKTLSETKFKKYDTIGDEVQRIFNSNFNACEKLQDAYDKETDHSKIKDEQYRWNTKISSMLDSLSTHTETELKVDVGYLIN